MKRVEIWQRSNFQPPSRHCWRVFQHFGNSHLASACLPATSGFGLGHCHQYRWIDWLVQMICTQRQWACKGKMKLWYEHCKQEQKKSLPFMLYINMLVALFVSVCSSKRKNSWMRHRKAVQHTLGLILATEYCSALGFMGDSRNANQGVRWAFRNCFLSAHPTW